jgi:hypothetical protein
METQEARNGLGDSSEAVWSHLAKEWLYCGVADAARPSKMTPGLQFWASPIAPLIKVVKSLAGEGELGEDGRPRFCSVFYSNFQDQSVN